MKNVIRKIIYYPCAVLKKTKKNFARRFMDKNLAAWYADPRQKTLRYDYDLNENSVVLDLGGYEGQWASDIFSRYVCNLYVFEPVKEFALHIKNRFKKNSKIKVFDFGLGAKTREEKIFINADGSSIFRGKTGKSEIVKIVDAVEFISQRNFGKISLMKVNIEGGEYELLERLLETGFMQNIDNLQVQFHNIAPDSEKRMAAIQSSLAKTHKTTYQYKFVWENWTLK